MSVEGVVGLSTLLGEELYELVSDGTVEEEDDEEKRAPLSG